MDKWSPLPGDRMIKKHPVGYQVIVPKDKLEPVPLECPVCKILMRDREDVISYSTYKCCNHCEIMWAYSNSEKWESGWRPNADEVDRVRKQRLTAPTYTVS